MQTRNCTRLVLTVLFIMTSYAAGATGWCISNVGSQVSSTVTLLLPLDTGAPVPGRASAHAPGYYPIKAMVYNIMLTRCALTWAIMT
jgi:hypothetical protein